MPSGIMSGDNAANGDPLMAKCPFCDVRASTVANLKTHLAGRKSDGGHEKRDADAREIAEQVFGGGYRPPAPSDKPAEAK
jgi:hypothetical protein